MTKLHLELTTQQAVELELLLETVKVFGVRITEQTGYTPAIAKTHDEIRSWLDAKVVEQNQKPNRS